MKLFALLIGINKYPIPTELSQCVSDVAAMKKYLNGLKNHFEKVEILPLIDQQATKKGIQKGISKFLAQATDDDVALLYYSGHGAHEDADGRFPHEADGKLECLVAYHTSDEDSGFLLANKEIRYLLSQLPANPHLISVFDCCHSGNIVRSIDEKNEDLTLKRLTSVFPARKVKEFIFAKEIPLKKFQNKTVEKLIKAKNSIHISACTSSQSSWENSNGGVFTRYLLALLKATNNHLTYQEITRWAKVSLRNMTKTQQTPTISVQGSGDLNPFSSWLNLPIKKTRADAEKLVMHTEKHGWQLLRGKVMGIEKGMELTIPIGKKKVVKAKTGGVSFDSAKLVFKGDDEALLDTTKKYAANLQTIDSKLKLFVNDLDFDAPSKKMVENIIGKFEKAKLTDKASADYWVNIFNQLTYLSLPNDDYRPLAMQIDLLKEVKAKDSNKKVLETEKIMKKRVAAELLNQLEYLAKWHHLDTLENADSGFDTPPIQVEIRPEGSSKWIDITNVNHHLQSEMERLQGFLFKKYEIKITNKTRGKLYVAALMLNNDMGISATPFDGQVIELPAKASKLFYDHLDDTLGAVVVDKYKEFYNWKAEFFHFKFIVNNFENFSDVLPKFVQPALPNPITTLKRGKDKDLKSKGGIPPTESNPKKWGTIKTTIWLNNPHYNEIHGKLARDWNEYQKDERLSPFFEHLYFETASDGVVFKKEVKPSAAGKSAQARNILGIKKTIGNFLGNLQRKRLFKRARRRWPNRPVVIAEGDSWFLYPILVKDTIDYVMEEFPVRSLAAAGDELKNYRLTGDLTREIKKIKPDFVLISGGGNDVIGPGIKDLLKENIGKGKPAEDYLKLEEHAAKMQKLVEDYAFFFKVIDQLPSVKHTFVHGYDYVRSDHKADWVKKGWVNRYLLDFKIDDAADRQRIINFLVDYFNELLEDLTKQFPKVTFVKMLNKVEKKEWFDEIHPNDVGFKKVGQRFIEAIKAEI